MVAKWRASLWGKGVQKRERERLCFRQLKGGRRVRAAAGERTGRGLFQKARQVVGGCAVPRQAGPSQLCTAVCRPMTRQHPSLECSRQQARAGREAPHQGHRHKRGTQGRAPPTVIIQRSIRFQPRNSVSQSASHLRCAWVRERAGARVRVDVRCGSASTI